MAAFGQDFEITSDPDNPALREFLDEGINEFNRQHTGIRAFQRVGFAVRDAEGRIVGGVHGWIWGEWYYVQSLFVVEAARGQGLARHLMEAAEAEAIRLGARHAYLETRTFQARPLYEKLGYRVTGEIEGYPAGETYYLMRKDLEG
jgi:ribosomal protein S18 acetylase RimI-like enzyme